MKQSFVRLTALAFALAACAGRQSPRTNPEAKPFLDAAFACAVNAVEGGGYKVRTDDRTLAVHGLIREDLPADLASRGGTGEAVGQGRSNGDVSAPYEVDGIDAIVSLKKNGDVKIEADAYTGVGASSKSGYRKGSASPRGTSTLKRVQDCAP
jgi:hypothetical protein